MTDGDRLRGGSGQQAASAGRPPSPPLVPPLPSAPPAPPVLIEPSPPGPASGRRRPARTRAPRPYRATAPGGATAPARAAAPGGATAPARAAAPGGATAPARAASATASSAPSASGPRRAAQLELRPAEFTDGAIVDAKAVVQTQEAVHLGVVGQQLAAVADEVIVDGVVEARRDRPAVPGARRRRGCPSCVAARTRAWCGPAPSARLPRRTRLPPRPAQSARERLK